VIHLAGAGALGDRLQRIGKIGPARRLVDPGIGPERAAVGIPPASGDCAARISSMLMPSKKS
jgi:hypothetical protein